MASSVAAFVGMFLLMVAITLVLRQRGVFTRDSATALSTVLMRVVIPTVVFHSFAKANPEIQHLIATGVVYAAELLAAVVAYLAGRWLLRLERAALGVFIISCTFGSTSLIGNSLVQILFKDDPTILSMSMIVGQFAFGIPTNTVAVFLAMRFGTDESSVPLKSLFMTFVRHPTLLALFAGMTWSLLGLPETGFGLDIIFGTCTFIGAALPMFTAMIVGLSLTSFDLRRDLPVFAVALVIALFVEPMIVSNLLGMFHVDDNTRLITVLFAAMPATPISVAYALQFGGDAALASKLSTATLIASAVSLPLIALIN